MRVSVVVPAYNEEKNIKACLDSLVAQKEKADEIILVDNNSTDDTVKIAKKYKEVHILHEIKQGITPARNKGFEAAKHEIIARTDADTVVPATWIKRIKRDFEKNPDIVGLSGRLYFSEIPEVMKKNTYWPPAAFLRAANKIFKHDIMMGPNMALRKSAWGKIKNEICLDDKLVHEDYDLAIHLSTIGEVLFDKNLRVIASSRRFKKLKPYFEYPYRYFKMLGKHKKLFIEFDSKKHLRRLKKLRKISLKKIIKKVID